MIEPLPVHLLRNVADPSSLECTDRIEPLDGIVGQDRALRALLFGLEIQEKGFNIYVSGMPGTGRRSAVQRFIAELAKAMPRASDWVYVNNFPNPYEPLAIRLPAGRGIQFKADMAGFITEAKQALPKAFESEDYAGRREGSVRSIEAEKAKVGEQINKSAQEHGFLIQMSPIGLVTIPIVDGKPLSEEEFAALPPETQQEIQKKKEGLNADLRTLFRQMRELDAKGSESVEKINREVALYAIGHFAEGLREKYADIPEILAYLKDVQDDIVNNLPLFLGIVQPQQQIPPQFQMYQQEMLFRKYVVNVLVDNTSLTGAPVIVEQNPTYQNLLGRAEKEVQFGVVSTDFTLITSGAIHKANGGFLVMMVEDLFRTPFAWDGLKTALKTGQVAIEEPGERMGFISIKGLKPKTIPLKCKIVLIGTPLINQILYTRDPDFKDLFKVKCEFDVTMDRNEQNIQKYIAFLCALCESSKLRHLDGAAVAKIIEYGSRLAADRNKMSTRFADVADIVREASFYAVQKGFATTTAACVQKAIEEKIYRSNLIQEKIEEYITKGIFLIDTEGKKVGQVNGLSVISLGDFAFGRPSRVTASIGIGKGRIIDIEREASMGGPIHTKGVLILSGFLADKFAGDKPLSFYARLVFEQSYEGVEGDSASSTELYAILSALANLPLSQSLAVTGSVNQKGEVQAIGGVNEKIEGYYEVCKRKGLTGQQGVVIPASNVQNLMLKEEVVEAAKAGKFHVYPVHTIDEGIEVLTGVPAGVRDNEGHFGEGTVNFLVDRRLQEMAGKLREYAAPGT